MEITKKTYEEAVETFLHRDCYDVDDLMSKSVRFIVGLSLGDTVIMTELKKEVLGIIQKDEELKIKL